ncbi:hypothetical protein ACFQV4_25285 [Streptomyces thermocarboxydus]
MTAVDLVRSSVAVCPPQPLRPLAQLHPLGLSAWDAPRVRPCPRAAHAVGGRYGGCSAAGAAPSPGNLSVRRGPVSAGLPFPGRRPRNRARDEARARMQDLMRRTAPEAERLRRERAQRQSEDGDDE